jgi:hypothetical protein
MSLLPLFVERGSAGEEMEPRVVDVGGGGVDVVVEAVDFRGDRSRSWLILDAAAAPRNEDRGLLVLTLGSGVYGLLLLLLVVALSLCFVEAVLAVLVEELFVLVDAARSRDSSSS